MQIMILVGSLSQPFFYNLPLLSLFTDYFSLTDGSYSYSGFSDVRGEKVALTKK